MRSNSDAMGRLFYKFWKGKDVLEIVERDDGYIEANKVSGYFAPFEKWPLIERRAMKYARGRVLDIGCGAGRHSLYLQKKGLDVTGIDRSPLAVKVCRGRGLKKVRLISISQLNPGVGKFDTLLMLGNNFGLFGSFRKARKLLRKFHSITGEGATIIAETLDIYKNATPFHRQYHRLNMKRGRMPGQVRIRVRHEKYATPWFDYLLVSKDEMERIVRGTGWKIRKYITSSVLYIAIIEKEPKMPAY